MAMIGQVAHVEWPYLVEARIDSIATDTVKYFLDKNTQQLTSQLVELEVYNNVKKEMKSASSYLMKKKGIDVGDCKLLVEARLMMGKRFVFCHDLFSLACIVSTRIIIRQNAFHYFLFSFIGILFLLTVQLNLKGNIPNTRTSMPVKLLLL